MALPPNANPTLPDVETLILRLEQAVEPLRTCRDLSGSIRDEVANLVASIEAPRRAAGNIATLDGMVGTIANVCTFLTPFPVVGAAASRIGDILGKFVRTPLHEVARLLREADKQMMKPVDDELARLRPIFEALEEALHELGDVLEELVTTLKVVSAIATLLEGLAGMSGNTEARRQVARTLASYNDGARNVLQAADSFTATVSTLQNAGSVVTRVVPPVREFLDSATQVVFAPVNRMLDHLGFLRGICETARGWLKPFSYVLKLSKWFIENTIGKLIDKILSVLGLKKLVDKLKDKIAELLGLKAIQNFAKSINDTLESLTPKIFQEIANPLDQLRKLKDKLYLETRVFASDAVQNELRQLMQVLLDDTVKEAGA